MYSTCTNHIDTLVQARAELAKFLKRGHAFISQKMFAARASAVTTIVNSHADHFDCRKNNAALVYRRCTAPQYLRKFTGVTGELPGKLRTGQDRQGQYSILYYCTSCTGNIVRRIPPGRSPRPCVERSNSRHLMKSIFPCVNCSLASRI